jgi:hippurate hydrolase
MCGHDGHTACLLGGMSIYLENLSKIPSNRGVRFLFQPGEEGAGGALEMIKDGCLDNVDEIYGNHNLPSRELAGKVCCHAGPMTAGGSIIELKIKGIGGHGSKPECCKNPVPVTAEVYLKIQAILDQAMAENSEMKGSIPKFVGSNALNVIPEDCTIGGSIRSFSLTEPIELLAKME